VFLGESDIGQGSYPFGCNASLHGSPDGGDVQLVDGALRDLPRILPGRCDGRRCESSVNRRLPCFLVPLFPCSLVMIGRVSGRVGGRVSGRVSGFLLPVHILILQVIHPRYDGSVLGSFGRDCLLPAQCVKAVSNRLPITAVTL
jgi:hypothetical protein